jgi:hypothetical protein
MPMRREPPVAVRRQLAEEVGFGCPVEGCGSPYLTWHHFDPPWAEREHHDPSGMVALCRDHHPEADAKTFTIEELRKFKREGRDRSRILGARFNWMRRQVLAVVGGNFFFETPIAVQYCHMPVVWFNRDPEGRLLVNLQALTTSEEPRMLMLDNFWMTEGTDEREIQCPPSGRLVSATYPNGDNLKVEFRELSSVEELDQRYPRAELPADLAQRYEAFGMDPPERRTSHVDTVREIGIEFPLAGVEITMDVAGAGLTLGPCSTSIGTNTITGSWMSRCGVGIQIGDPGNGAAAENAG